MNLRFAIWFLITNIVLCCAVLKPRTVNAQVADVASESIEPANMFGFLETGWPEPVGNFRDWLVPERLGYRPGLRRWQFSDQTTLEIANTARTFFLSDFRLEFTGQETYFTAENQTFARIAHDDGFWNTSLTSELHLNLPFDDNLLTDYALRESFAGNFEIDTLEMSQLFVTVARHDLAVDLGRFVTPFGRYVAQVNSNLRFDAPFIRTESILPRETGLQIRFQPGILRLAAAITNGSDGRDTNSSKAIVARTGIETESISSGASVKWQDGIGSEGQKEFNNHAGIDFAITRGAWTLASEVIYDQYGLRRPGTPLDEITWGRSIYNRQLNNGLNNPIDGWGWYANAIRRTGRSTLVFGYGEFYPEQIGDAIQDQTTRRFIGKGTWQLNRHLDFLATSLFENEVREGQAGRPRKGIAVLLGLQFHF